MILFSTTSASLDPVGICTLASLVVPFMRSVFQFASMLSRHSRYPLQPMTDLILLMSKLVTPDGKILIPRVYDSVKPLQPGELYVLLSHAQFQHLFSPRSALYEALDYGIPDIELSAGAKIAISSDKTTALMGRMREPSLSLHGIEGAFYAPGAKTVIPASVTGKFSLRLVPDQTPEAINELVEAYLSAEFKKLNSKNTFKIELQQGGGKPWVDDPNHWNFQAAKKATESVYGKTPDFTREGGSIPVTLTFADSLKKSVCLLPMGRGDDGAQYVSTVAYAKRRN